MLDAEIISHKNDFSEQIAAYITSNESLSDSETRRDFFENMDEEDFLNTVQQIAALIRTGDDAHQQYFDGKTVRLLLHEVPDQREKEALLRETWQTAQIFLHDRDLSDEDALEYSALTVAGGLLYTHPFIDGNGRTSRVFSYLMARGSTHSNELREITTESPNTSWQVAPVGLILPERNNFAGYQPDTVDWKWSYAGEGNDALGGIITNSRYSKRIIRTFIERRSSDIMELVNHHTTIDQRTKQRHLNADAFLEEIVNDSEKGMIYAKELLDINREIRADYVHRFLKALTSSTTVASYDIKTEDFDPDYVPITEFTEKQKKVFISEFGKRAIDGKLRLIDQEVIRHRAFSTIHHRNVV